MKKIVTLFTTLFLLIGMGQAQDVYFAGNSATEGKVWKNNTLIYTISDSINIQLNDLQLNHDGTVYTVGYTYDNSQDYVLGHIWENNTCIFNTDTNFILTKMLLSGDGWTTSGVNKVWQNGEALYTYTAGEGGCVIQSIAIDTVNNDFYAGGVIETLEGDFYACIWQNDTTLWLEERNSSVEGLCFDGESLYAAGFLNNDDTWYGIIWQNDSIIVQTENASFYSVISYNGSLYWTGLCNDTAYVWQDNEVLYTHPNYTGIKNLIVNEFGVYYSGSCDGIATVFKDGEILYQPEGCSNIRGLGVIPTEDPQPTFTLTVEVDSIGGGIVTGGGAYYYYDTATIEAIPDMGFEFLYWNDSITDNPLEVVVSQDSAFIAHFGFIDYTIATSVDPENAGTVTEGGIFHYGDTLTLEAIPNAGFAFEMWNDSVTDNPRDIVVTQDSTFSAHFISFDYVIQTSVDPEDAGIVTGGGLYNFGDTISLEAIPNAGFVFDMWNDSITDNPRDIVVTQDSSFIALFSYIDYTITASVEPEGAGTVTGSGVYHYGDTLPLEAIPNEGFAFEMWNDSVTDNPRIIVVTQDSAFIAQFQLINYNIATSVEPEDAGTVTGGGIFHYGDTLTLEAIPNAGFAFEMWNDSVTDNPRDIVVTQDSSFIALFGLINYSIMTLADPENGGSVTGGGLYHYGDTITIEALPNAGYFFEMWDDGVTDNPRNIVVTQDITFTANFGLIDYNISTAVEPENAGTVTPGGVFHYGDTLMLEAIPNAGYAFDMWNDGVTDNPRDIVVTQDNDFIAIFSLIDYSIETLADPENGGTVTGGGIYHYGDNISLEATPSVGYFFEMWSDSITDNPRNIVVTQDSSIIAHFGLIDYSIKAFVDPEGTGVATGSGLYHYGDSLTLEVIPNAGFVFEMWNDSITNNPRNIVVTQDSVFTAHLIPIQCLIETQVVPEGTGIITGDGLYTYGDTIQLEAIPNTGFEFLIWTDGCHDNPRTIVVTESQTYTATFGLKQCVVNAVAMPEEGGIVIGGGTYSYGDTILLVAQNNVGFAFKIWEDEVFDNPRQVIIKDDITYTAIFSPLLYEIKTSCEPVGGGTVEGGGYYPYGATATLHARPFNNYSFICWSDGIVSNPRNITVTQDASYKALFRFDGNPEYIIKVTVNNYTWGSVEGTGVYPEGSNVEIKAIPTDSTQFVRWDDGNTDNPRTITVTSDMVFTAIFEPIPVYTITVRSASNNMGTVYGGGTFMANSVIEIGAIPEDGYYFTGWQDGDMNNPRTIIVTEDAEYEANFSRTPTPTFTVTVYYDENQGFILGAGTYIAGSTASLAAIPADGYMFVKWSDDTTDNPKEVLVDQDIVLAAFFTGTSVDENGFEIITLYPNPANDIIHIDGLEGEHEVQIFNALGMLVMTTTLQGDSEINICDLPTGYYLIRIDSHHSIKFIKENK